MIRPQITIRLPTGRRRAPAWRNRNRKDRTHARLTHLPQLPDRHLAATPPARRPRIGDGGVRRRHPRNYGAPKAYNSRYRCRVATTGAWKAKAERDLAHPFDLWDVAEAFLTFVKNAYEMKHASRALLRDVHLEAIEGDFYPKSVKEARDVADRQRLTPQVLWFYVDGETSENRIMRKRVGFQVRVDFPASLASRTRLVVNINGQDRDETVGLGHRSQTWLDSLTPASIPAGLPAATSVGKAAWWKSKTFVWIAGPLVVLGIGAPLLVAFLSHAFGWNT